MSVQLSELVVALKANTGAFSAKMKGASAVTSSFHSRVREGIGTAAKYGSIMAGVVAAGLVVYTKRSLEAIDATGKLAGRMGTTVAAVEGLRFAAQIMGASASDMDKSLQEMNARLGEAAGGTGEAKDALKAMGLELDSLLGMGVEQQFMTIIDAMSKVQSTALQGAYASDIFGRAGKKELLGLLQNADAVRGLRAEYDKLHGVTSAADYGMVAEANDDILRAKAAVTGWADAFTVRLAPAISLVAEKFFGVASAGEGATDGMTASVDALTSKLVTLTAYLADAAETIAAISPSLSTIETVVTFGAKISPLSLGGKALKAWDAMFGAHGPAPAKDERPAGEKFLEEVKAQRQATEEKIAADMKAAEVSRNKAVAEAADAAVMEQARAVIESLATPLDKYNEKVAQLNLLHEKLTPEQFAAAMAKAREEYEAADPAVQALTSSMAALAAQGEALAESLVTPGEAFNKKLADYREMLDAGAITPETYQRAVADAQKDLAAINDTQQDLTDGATDYASALDEVARAAEAARAAAEGTTFGMRRAGTGGPASSGIAGGYAAMGLPGATSGIGSYGMGGGAGYSGGGAAAVPNGPSRDGGQWQQVIALLRQIASNTGAPGMAFVG